MQGIKIKDRKTGKLYSRDEYKKLQKSREPKAGTKSTKKSSNGGK